MYFIIQINNDKKHYSTEIFGNCNQAEAIDLNHKSPNIPIQFRFSGDAQSSRIESIYEYSPNNHKIVKLK